MPTSGEEDILLVGTRVAVALLVVDHPHHEVVFDATARRDLGFAGHAAFETFSVLTRLRPQLAARRVAQRGWSRPTFHGRVI
jgi:toxin FitB